MEAQYVDSIESSQNCIKTEIYSLKFLSAIAFGFRATKVVSYFLKFGIRTKSQGVIKAMFSKERGLSSTAEIRVDP